jgi:uncharacterized protein (DUF2249 family)
MISCLLSGLKALSLLKFKKKMNTIPQPILISASTRISTLIRANPAAIEVIASINKHFQKLRNPLLRKVLASRVTIADAARIGGTEVSVFFDRLKAIGFVPEGEGVAASTPAATPKPDLPPLGLTLDVREALQSGHDPFREIMAAAEQLPPNQALLIINTFEPIPLLAILGKKGFSHYTGYPETNVVYTYFYRTGPAAPQNNRQVHDPRAAFDRLVHQYQENLVEIDVRQMEMPQPMITILEALSTLAAGKALFVYHRRLPQYLLPQLAERGFAYAYSEMGPNQVHLLIYKIPGHELDNG